MTIYHFWLIYGAVLIDNLCLYLYLSQNQTLSLLLGPFLTSWSFYLRKTASHVWRLHALWRVEFKNKKYTVTLITSKLLTKGKHCCVSYIFACYMYDHGYTKHKFIFKIPLELQPACA